MVLSGEAAKGFGFVRVAGHQVELVFGAGDDVIRANGDGQIDVRFVFRVTRISKHGWRVFA